MIRRLDRRFPRFAFARRLPPGRIATRVRRRIEQRLGLAARISAPVVTLRPRSEWPRLRFPPRHHAVLRDWDGWTFAFLGIELRFPRQIDWRPHREGIGQLWRMNLHYFEYLEVLGAEDGAEAIGQWIAANPLDAPEAHEAAWNPYATSLRVVCWLQWLARHSDGVAAPTAREIERSLALQAAFLARHPETDLGGNHLIKNVKALAWAGACFDGTEARAWRSQAAALLSTEIPRQILADGFHFERTPSYHCQVAADLIEISEALPERRAQLAPVIQRMVTAASALTHPDGFVAQFNDAGLHMAYPAGDLERALAGPPPRRPSVSIYADAGLAALRSTGLSTFVKYGVPGPATLPAHAHGDIGTFELSVGPHRAIVDQGVFEYVEGPLRRASRAASSHNLTAPADLEMADFFGAFRCGWMPSPRASLDDCHRDDLLSLEVTHDGFEGAGGPLRVRRKIVAQPQRLAIEDRVEGRRRGAAWATRFLLHPDWQALQTPGGWRMVGPGGCSLLVECEAPGIVEVAEWWPDMGVRVGTTRLVFPWGEGRNAIAVVMHGLKV